MLPSVSPGYVHADKTVSPRERFEAQGRRFKWYDVGAAGFPVPDAVRTMARAFLMRANLDAAGELGFVVLHRCGPDFHFLIVCS